MHNKIKFKNKLDLLLISIEALDLYTTNTLYKYIVQNTKLSQYIFLIRSGNCIRNVKNHTLFNFYHTIVISYQIYIYLKQIYLQEIIIKILNNHCNSINNSIEKQYFNRFKYIYERTQNSYNHYSYYQKVNIKQIAIINLYLIYKINNNYGFYFLIKYLLY
uniref:Uncharacterized protein n=1 Tax=Leiomenia cribrosa TaxID=217483 RepID=A0A4D6X0V1_9FLOR|nr:hypothetical protein [Leiomenia cribrosa]